MWVQLYYALGSAWGYLQFFTSGMGLMTCDFLKTNAGVAALFCIEKTVFTENIYMSLSSKGMTC